MSRLIISHIADIDGLGAVVIAKLVYPDINYKLVEFSELSFVIEDLVNSKEYLNYEEIFIADVSIRNELINFIANNLNLEKRIKHFDHHASEIENNQFPFVNVVLEKDGEAVCGTSLIYDYFLENSDNNVILNSELTKNFVEIVRCRDNWLKDRQEFNIGCDLTELSLMYGEDMYISQMVNILNSNSQLISDNERTLISKRYEEMEKYINMCDENLIYFVNNLGKCLKKF